MGYNEGASGNTSDNNTVASQHGGSGLRREASEPAKPQVPPAYSAFEEAMLKGTSLHAALADFSALESRFRSDPIEAVAFVWARLGLDVSAMVAAFADRSLSRCPASGLGGRSRGRIRRGQDGGRD